MTQPGAGARPTSGQYRVTGKEKPEFQAASKHHHPERLPVCTQLLLRSTCRSQSLGPRKEIKARHSLPLSLPRDAPVKPALHPEASRPCATCLHLSPAQWAAGPPPAPQD